MTTLDQAIAINLSSTNRGGGDNDITNWINNQFLLACLKQSPKQQLKFKASIRQRGKNILWSLSKKLPRTETLINAIKTNMAKLTGDNANAIKEYHRTLVGSEEVHIKGIYNDAFDTLQFLRNMDKAGHTQFRTSLESAITGDVETEGVSHFTLAMGINEKDYPAVIAFEAEATEQAPEPAVEQSAEEETAF